MSSLPLPVPSLPPLVWDHPESRGAGRVHSLEAGCFSASLARGKGRAAAGSAWARRSALTRPRAPGTPLPRERDGLSVQRGSAEPGAAPLCPCPRPCGGAGVPGRCALRWLKAPGRSSGRPRRSQLGGGRPSGGDGSHPLPSLPREQPERGPGLKSVSPVFSGRRQPGQQRAGAAAGGDPGRPTRRPGRCPPGIPPAAAAPRRLACKSGCFPISFSLFFPPSSSLLGRRCGG